MYVYRYVSVSKTAIVCLTADCVSDYCSCATLFFPGDIHVDVDGGSSVVCGSCQGVCH